MCVKKCCRFNFITNWCVRKLFNSENFQVYSSVLCVHQVHNNNSADLGACSEEKNMYDINKPCVLSIHGVPSKTCTYTFMYNPWIKLNEVLRNQREMCQFLTLIP